MSGSRADRRSNTLRLIVAATVDAIVELGADSVTVTEIARRAGVSRPTVYSLVGSTSGAFAEVWVAHGTDWLAATLATDAPSRAPMAGAHTPIATAMSEILMIAGRDDEVSELVQRDLESMWRDASAAGGVALVRSIWLLAAALGVEMSAGLSENLELGEQALQLVRELRGSGTDRLTPGDPPFAPLVRHGERPLRVMSPSGDDTTTQLIEAAVAVVASAGVARASMLRICRVAGVTTGAGRPRFTSVEELVLAGFACEIDSVVDENIGVISGTEGGDSFMDLYAEFITAGLAPDRRRWRMFRQELHLAARVNPTIHASLRQSISRSEADLAAVITFPTIGLSDAVADAALGVNQILSVGLPALHRLGLPVEQLDHRIPLQWVYRAATGLAGT